ncbi:DUF930 domain-containing protein [uncultured Cohaesibacter sp.]|uniref:DUF930 domain-containing protein n=1 Tax=uncultured Cohaesibacter sp. TaxID=1002546 RepID=UPI00292EC48B
MKPSYRDQNGMTLQGLGLSLLLHCVLFAGLALIAPRILDPIMEQPIAVEIIPPPIRPAPMKGSGEANARRVLAPPAPDDASDMASGQQEATDSGTLPEEDAKDGMVHARVMLSANALKVHADDETRQDFKHLTSDERREQLCALESLQQIAAWSDAYKPERMVTYTFEEVRYEEGHVIANGAVFWSHDNWHRVKFDCELSQDLSEVLSFAFAVGTIVPKEDWEAYYLTEYK